MIATLKAYAAAFVAALVAMAGAVLYLRGRQDANDKQTADNLQAAVTAKDNRYELENTDDQRLVDILSGKLRNDKR